MFMRRFEHHENYTYFQLVSSTHWQLFETKYSRMGQVKFVEDSLKFLTEYGLFEQAMSLKFFKRLSSTIFTWSILEY